MEKYYKMRSRFCVKINIFSVKSTFLLRKLLKSWFHEFFFSVIAIYSTFPHCAEKTTSINEIKLVHFDVRFYGRNYQPQNHNFISSSHRCLAFRFHEFFVIITGILSPFPLRNYLLIQVCNYFNFLHKTVFVSSK